MQPCRPPVVDNQHRGLRRLRDEMRTRRTASGNLPKELCPRSSCGACARSPSNTETGSTFKGFGGSQHGGGHALTRIACATRAFAAVRLHSVPPPRRRWSDRCAIAVPQGSRRRRRPRRTGHKYPCMAIGGLGRAAWPAIVSDHAIARL